MGCSLACKYWTRVEIVVNGAETLSVTTLSIKTPSIKTLSIKTLSIKTLSIMISAYQ